MGLDMFAYTASKSQADPDSEQREQREIAYWRKHPNLHGWMERLAQEKNVDYDSFNGVELELTWADIDALEQAVTHKQLPATSGFFFGRDADELY